MTIKAFYRWAIEEGFTNENPTTKIKLAKPNQKVIRGLLPEQIKTMIDVVKGDSQESALAGLWYEGIGTGEPEDTTKRTR